jgi:hypothetical protein
MKISKNFRLEEFTYSPIAIKEGLDNTPDEAVIARICTLVTKLLQPLRNFYGGPMLINSGYRSAKVNMLVGGAANSQHLRGEAADIKVPRPQSLLKALLKSGLEFDQAILYSTFLHISYTECGRNRRQVLYKTDARYE